MLSYLSLVDIQDQNARYALTDSLATLLVSLVPRHNVKNANATAMWTQMLLETATGLRASV